MNQKIHILRAIMWGLVIAAALNAIGDSVLRPRSRQVDFLTYYTAGQTWAQGNNPYSLEMLSEVAGEEIHFSFTYPPITLPFFRLFSFMPFITAARLWVLLKLALLAALICLWRKHFVPGIDPLIIALVLAYGFNRAIPKDFLGGNVTVVVQLILWLGLLHMLRGKAILGTSLVAMAAVFKLVPIAFVALPLLFDHRDRRNWLAAGWGVALFGAIVAGPMIFWPDMLEGYMNQTGAESSLTTPSKWQPYGFHLITSIGQKIWDGQAPYWVPLVTWMVFIVGLIVVSWAPVARAKRSNNRTELTMYLIVLYSITILPIRPYILVVAIVPVLWIFTKFFKHIDTSGVLTAVLFSMQVNMSPLGLGMALSFRYLPWTVLTSAWFAFCLLHEKVQPGDDEATAHCQMPWQAIQVDSAVESTDDAI